MMIEPETFRDQIVQALELASSATSQTDYARNAPIADVVAETIETWFDLYHPSVPTFGVAFNRAEREALAEYASTIEGISPSVAGMTLREFQSSPFSARVALAAKRALVALGRSHDEQPG